MEKAKVVKISAAGAALVVAAVVIAMQFTGPRPGDVIIEGDAQKPAATASQAAGQGKPGKPKPPPIKREGGGRLAPGAGG